MMKKYITICLAIFLALGLTLFNGCKKSDNTEQVLLSVTVTDGVNGTPISGSDLFDKNAQVVYSYSLKDRYQNLVVTLDGTQVEAEGTINMDQNHALKAEAEPIPGDFLLSVATSLGVEGTPERGNYYYNSGETLDYSYTLKEGYINLRLTLNGEEVPAQGTIVFDRAHTLHVFSDKFYEIRGTWKLEEVYNDGSAFQGTMTFVGTSESGTVTDSDGGEGTYEVVGPAIEFTLVYPDVTYEYKGTFVDEETMSGTSKRITPSETYNGQWGGKLESASTTAGRTTFQGKGRVSSKIEKQ